MPEKVSRIGGWCLLQGYNMNIIYLFLLEYVWW